MKSLSSVGLGLSIVFGCLLLALIAELYYLLWWKSRLRTSTDLENDFKNPEEQQCSHHQLQLQLHHNLQSNKDLFLNPFDEEHGTGNEEQSPRFFLFTIIEETMEDPLTPIDACFTHQFGFNPLFESQTDAEFTNLSSSSSPHPPSFTGKH